MSIPRYRPLPRGLRWGSLAVAAALSLVAAEAQAQDYQGARLLGFSRARRALGFGNDALYVNPAGLSFAKTYEIELGYADDLRDTDRRINLGIADAQSGDVAGALSATYGKFRPDGQYEGSQRLEGLRFDVGAAALISPQMAIGTTARYSDYRLLDGDEEIEGGGSNGFSFDVGYQWRLSEGVAIGLVIQNITAAEQPGIPRAWAAGLGYQTGSFTLEVDVDHAWETSDPEWTGSLGYILAEKFPLRGGFTYVQETDDFRFSVGAGLMIDQIGFDVAYQQVIGPSATGTDADERILAASFRIFAFGTKP